jgi:hypothetical protein
MIFPLTSALDASSEGFVILKNKKITTAIIKIIATMYI